MSKFSGKCDLYDHLMMEKMYDAGNNRVSDELECFNIFREKTKGVLYQNIPLVLTMDNIETELKNEDNKVLSRIEEHVEIPDKRTKTGKRICLKYKYNYLGNIYTSLEAINKIGYRSVRRVYFSNIYELVKYYPYLISSAGVSATTEKIYISEKSYLDTRKEAMLNKGISVSGIDYCEKLLAMHYRDITLKYFNPVLRMTTCKAIVNKELDYFYLKVPTQIDTLFDVTITIPARTEVIPILDITDTDAKAGIIKLDPEYFKDLKERDLVSISYVKLEKPKLFLE